MPEAGYLFDDRYLLHETGSLHPESPARLQAIKEALASFPSLSRWRRLEPRAATMEELALIHDTGHVARVDQASLHAPAYLDPDTPVSAASYRTALLAAGGVMQCAEELLSGRLQRAFAFVRPPGHHAGPARSMGFCLFNNIALAAAYAHVLHHLERIAIVDIDLHHGNGTQHCFHDNPHVLYISTHQYPFYPGTGAFEEKGGGEGGGYTVNFPLPARTGDPTIVPIYSRIVAGILDQYRPQLILVSAGFDCHHRDPLGDLMVTAEGCGSVGASLIRAADRSCSGKILFVLEGGYSFEGLQDCTQAVMAEMESPSPNELPYPGDALFDAVSEKAKKHHGGLWKW